MSSTRKLASLLHRLRLGPQRSKGVHFLTKRLFRAIPRGQCGFHHLTNPHLIPLSRASRSLAPMQMKNPCAFLTRERFRYKYHQELGQVGWRNISTSSVRFTPDSTKSAGDKGSSSKENGDVQSKKSSIKLPDPEIDWDFILKEENLDSIHKNIENRKGVGDIERVKRLWNKLNYPEEVEIELGGDKTKLKKKLLTEAISLPNLTHPDVPVGDESQNVITEQVGSKRVFHFRPKTILQIGEELGMLRTENLGHTTGPKTYYFMDGFAQLEQALVKYTIDYLEKAGFSLVSVPDLIHPDIVERCGFKTTGERTQVYKLDPHKHGEIALAGTGEMPIAGMLLGQKFKHDELPKKLMTVSRCFRAETSDLEEEKGIYRVHQFTKVEMFGVTTQDTGSESQELLDEFTNLQKALFSELGLHFRILDMASQELGAPAYRKFDMEAWMPAKQFWGEISSASNCTDYQSRRLAVKYEKGSDTQHVHTINGTACAVPRMIMAIVENNQNKDGTVEIPKILHPYMDGVEVLTKTPKHIQMKWIKLTKQYKSKTKS